MLQFYLQLLDTEEEQRGFTLLYEIYRKLMHWVAKGILRDEGLAEDAVQEAFLRIAKNFYKIKEILCPETRNFVVIIVRNAALAMQQKQARDAEHCVYDAAQGETQHASEDELHTILGQVSCGFDETADSLLAKELGLAVIGLPDKLREVLFLYGYLGYHMKEIAALLAISEDAAYKRLQRARNMLTQIWDREGERS